MLTLTDAQPYYSLFHYTILFTHSHIYRIMDRPKRPPPVPKFEEKNDKAELEKKLNSFISSISTSGSAESRPELAKAEPVRAEAKEEVGKKKMTLASLNSKLNNMLSAKKININAAISSEVEKEKREEQRKAVEIQYDPQHPNSYELTRHAYAAQLATLASSDQQEEAQESLSCPQQQESEECEPEEKEQIALRMMQKFGFKVGEGLGKQSQGIRTPLIVRKTTDSSGVIEQSNIPLNFLISRQMSAKNALAAHGVESSEVLVLVGLLSLEQLEEGLEEEIRQECCLYGVVCDWVMYLYAGELRIFVEFQSREQALHAFVKMNGKYFGERLVSVRFYSLLQFHARVLSDSLHPHVNT